jgi:hypothetical protein
VDRVGRLAGDEVERARVEHDVARGVLDRRRRDRADEPAVGIDEVWVVLGVRRGHAFTIRPGSAGHIAPQG